MSKADKTMMIPDELVMNKICFIRRQKVMIHNDLADLYDVENKRLKEAVRRNIDRFPEDFMFELTQTEFESLRSQFATSKTAEEVQGIAMLSEVLNSETAIRTTQFVTSKEI